MRRLARRGLASLAVIASIASVPAPVAAQGGTVAVDTLAEARRARDAGHLRPAAQLLAAYVRSHPRDAEALRLLGQTLYWLGDAAGARAQYEQALALGGRQPTLRLEYARMLVETGASARARVLLQPLRGDAAAGAEAETLLGTIEYWSGDFSAALSHFREAIRLDPEAEEARQRLAEIASVTRPFLTLGSRGQRDDQPVRRMGGGIEGGWFVTPLATLRVEGGSEWLGGTRTHLAATSAALRLGGYAHRSRLEWQLGGGVFRRDSLAGIGPAATEWVGAMELGVRLPGRLVLAARAERQPYLQTDASLDTVLITLAASGRLAWSPPSGWLGEAGYEAQRFADGNVVSAAYGWLLAPLVHGDAGELRVGYAYNAQDSRESRFVIADGGGPGPGGRRSGRYEPYYTPDRVRVHSATGAFGVRGVVIGLRLDGAVAVRATEWVPVLVTSFPVGGTTTQVQPREFRPWRARGVLSASLSTAVDAELTGEHLRTAYYASSSFELRIVVRGRSRFGATR